MKYKVPFIDYSKEYELLGKEITKKTRRSLARGDIMRGHIDLFEEEFADYLGARNCVALNSGTDALFFALKVLGIKEEDEVITVSWTFIATIAAIVHCGAKPVLIDVGDDMVMDTDLLEAAITPKTKAILPVHLNGQVVNMDKVMEVAGKHGLLVVEDAAQAVGAKLGDKKAGTIGNIGCFSFYPAKILGCYGDGGGLITDSDDIAKEVRLIRNHYEIKGDISASMKYGWNSRLDNVQAIVLRVKLKHLNRYIQRRNEIAEAYNAGLKDISQIKIPVKQPVYQNYVIRAEKRDSLFRYLLNNGIEPMIRDKTPYHLIDGFALSHFVLPETKKLAEEVLSLPIFPHLTGGQQKFCISKIKQFYLNYRY